MDVNAVNRSWSRRALFSKALDGLVMGAVGTLFGCIKPKVPEKSAVSTAQPSPNELTSKLPHQIKLGTQQGPATPDMLRYLKRSGVTHICGTPIDEGNKGYFSSTDLKRLKSMCEAEGIVLSMIPLPFLSSSHVDQEKRAAILLGRSPEREKDIADIIRTIQSCAEVGIPAVKYNMSLLGVMRTGSNPGRGGASYSSFRLGDRPYPEKLTRAGVVSESVFWDRITWFLSKVVPVAEQLKVRIACHPQDPGTPTGGLHGIVNVLGTPDGLKKFLSIHESPWHGLNLCLGSVAEMLENPRLEMPMIVEHFAQTGKVFNVHFRNIRGRRDNFEEVYVDEGDIDMPQMARILAKYNYDGMLMPDHVPGHSSDPESRQAFAYAMGYIKGVLQAI